MKTSADKPVGATGIAARCINGPETQYPGENLPATMEEAGIAPAGPGTRPTRASLEELLRGDAFPRDGVYMGRSRGFWGAPQGWGNPYRVSADCEQARAEAVARFSTTVRSPSGRWMRLRLHELRGRRCYCHCPPGHACHVNELVTLFDEEAARWKASAEELPSLDGLSLAEAGLVLRSHLCWCYDVGPACRYGRSDTEREDKPMKELLPFPLCSRATPAEIDLCQAAIAGKETSHLLRAAGQAAWLFASQWGLSWLYEGRSRRWHVGTPSPDEGQLRGSQLAAADKLRDYVINFMSGPPVPALDWEAELNKAKLDYNLEEIKRPEMVTWAQIEPALPPAGKAACVRTLSLAEGWLADCLREPERCLLPPEQWPSSPPPGRVWVEDDSEWHRVCSGAAERGIFTFLRKDEVFHAKGEPVLNGLFGVPKKSTAADGPAGGLLRLIVNAIPTNAYQELLAADIRALPYFGQWSGIHLEDEEMVFTMSELDMTAAFYVFELEPAWWGFQALSKPVPGALAARWRAELASEELVYPAVKVMMMGWKSACGLMQYFHRRLCFAETPAGASLDTRQEIRRDCPVPTSSGSERASYLTVYLDNFTQAELIHWDRLAAESKESPEVRAVLEAWGRWGVPSQKSKAVLRSTEHQTLGCRIEGKLGLIGPPRQVLSELLGLTSWFTSGDERSLHQAQVLPGESKCPVFRHPPRGMTFLKSTIPE